MNFDLDLFHHRRISFAKFNELDNKELLQMTKA